VVFERRWALTLLDRVLARLRDEFRERGKEEVFDGLKNHLVGDEEQVSYRDAAARLGLSEVAARVAVHRLRRRFAELLRREVAETVATPEEIQEEIRHLVRAVSR
jgi:RNA polymerase sigma-70 factor (ECF subfamily)